MLLKDLETLGIEPGGVLLVHCAFSRVAAGTPEDLIAALLAAVGPHGTLVMPSMLRSLPSSIFIGPGDGAAPGAGCGNAVDRAQWKVRLPSTFCITWWIWPLSTVTEPKRFR